MNDEFQRHAELRHCVGEALSTINEHWRKHCGEAGFESWELEVRVGETLRRWPPPPERLRNTTNQHWLAVRDRGVRFETTVDAKLFLALFHRLCRSGGATFSTSVVDYVERGDDRRRVVHDSTHSKCVHQKKEQLRRPCDFERCIVERERRERAFDVRVSTCVESTMAEKPVSCTGTMTKRQRRSVVFVSAPHWRVDFTRIDDGAQHQIEVELLWPCAFINLRRSYESLMRKPSTGFDVYMTHCIVEQLIGVLERLNTASL